jgi:hypothetical protein
VPYLAWPGSRQASQAACASQHVGWSAASDGHWLPDANMRTWASSMQVVVQQAGQLAAGQQASQAGSAKLEPLVKELSGARSA